MINKLANTLRDVQNLAIIPSSINVVQNPWMYNCYACVIQTLCNFYNCKMQPYTFAQLTKLSSELRDMPHKIQMDVLHTTFDATEISLAGINSALKAQLPIMLWYNVTDLDALPPGQELPDGNHVAIIVGSTIDADKTIWYTMIDPIRATQDGYYYMTAKALQSQAKHLYTVTSR